MPADTPSINLQNVSKTYRGQIHALRGVDIQELRQDAHLPVLRDLPGREGHQKGKWSCLRPNYPKIVILKNCIFNIKTPL